MQDSLFNEYNEDKEIKKIFSIGDYVLGKYKKKEKEGYQMMEEKMAKWSNERQVILKEIQEIIEAEKGGKINVKVFAMKLAHVKTPDLYWMKSSGLDYRNRTKQPFAKFIYGSVKVKK